MKDYSYIIGKVTSTPWMMERSALALLLEILDAHVSGAISHDEIKVRLQDIDKRGTGSHASRTQNIGVLGITGPIFPKANMMTEMSGGTTMQQFQKDFRGMMADDSIAAILLDVDSPGGLSEGLPEMAEEIRQGRERKPVYSIANAAANSAAYFLASQARQMFATPSAQLGSVGTFMVHTDDSRRKEAQGVDETIIHAGRFKAVTHGPLDDDGHAYLQDYVNKTNDLFIQNVAAGRQTTEQNVRLGYGEGGIVTAGDALQRGMVDGIGTYEQVLAHIGSELGGMQSQSIAVNTTNGLQLRQSYDADMEHSEPGTGQGGPPTPREPPETGDPAIENGWRRDTPPPPYAPEFETEESAVNREWLEAQATALGIEFSADTTDEDLSSAVATRVEEVVVPLNAASQTAADERAFRERYPEQAAQLERLESRDRETSALFYADSYRAFEGDPTRGYSPVVRGLIAEAHMNISARQFTHEHLSELLNAASQKEGIVHLNEAGSSRQTETTSVVPHGDVRAARQQFADAVKTAMTEDNLSEEAAIQHVAEQNPELAQAYMTAHVR